MSFVADFWVAINGEAAADSNVRLATGPAGKDVIVTQGVYELHAHDTISVFGAGSGGAFIEFIEEEGEPNIPSIIVSVFKVGA